MTTLVNIDVLNPDTTPWAYAWVAVRLVDAGAGGVTTPGVVTGTQRVQCDASGHAEIALTPNASISPSGTFYAFTVERSSPSTVRKITVPVSPSEIDWDDGAYQVITDTPPVYIPAATSGAAGEVVTVNSTGDGFELAASGGGVSSTRTISTTAPLTGGGDLSANRTLAISAATTGAAGSMSSADKTKLDAITGTNTGDQTLPTLVSLGAVPTSRTLAGLDLSADRTASALRTALGLVIGTDVLAPTGSGASLTGVEKARTRLTFSNADYTIVTTSPSTIVSQTGTLSAARIVTLPAANTVPAGAEVIISAGLGATSTDTLSIARAGADTINGSASSIVVPTPYAWRRLISDGTSAWTLDAGILRQSDIGVTVASATWNPAPIRKAADESVNNATTGSTLQNDDELSFAIGANEQWQIEGEIFVSSTVATNDFQLGFTIPSGTLAIAIYGLATSVSAIPGAMSIVGVLTTSGTAAPGGAINGTTCFQFAGSVANGATPGTVQLQWAQNIAASALTTVLAGSILKRRRIA